MKKIFLFLLCCSSLFAGSVRLYNDSPYKLRAVIHAADGTYLGEMILLPQHFNTWSDEYSTFGPGGDNFTNPSRSLTPYTVHWHCLDGKEYGICTNVETGATVSAQSCDGARLCEPPKKKKKSRFGPGECEEQLHEQNEVCPESCPQPK